MSLVAHAAGDTIPLLAPHPLPLVAIIVACTLYLRACSILAGRGRTVPLAQQCCFVLGLAMIFVATQTGLDPLGEQRLLSAHMAQHLLLSDLPAPLLLFGLRAPVLYFLWPRPILVWAARRRVLRGAWSLLRQPRVALTIWLATLGAWHVPAVYQAAMHHHLLHQLEHVLFAFTGMLCWYPVLDPLCRRGGELWRSLYLVAARSLGGIIGIVMLAAADPIYPSYGDAARAYGMTPVEDQQLAGAMMMSVDFFVVVGGVLWLLARSAGNADVPSAAATAQPRPTASADGASDEPWSSATVERTAATVDS